MPEFAVGDKVEVIEHIDNGRVGKRGEIIHAGTGIKPVTQPVHVNLPKQETEPRFSVTLDDGGELHNLRETQLRKL